MEGERIDPQPPFVLSMLVCDHVHVDPATGKQTILGCFSSIMAPSFPVAHHGLTIFAELTDGRGEIPLKIRIIDADEERDPVFEADATLPESDPLVVAQVIMRVPQLVFPEPGDYRIQMFSGDAPLMERRLAVGLVA